MALSKSANLWRGLFLVIFLSTLLAACSGPAGSAASKWYQPYAIQLSSQDLDSDQALSVIAVMSTFMRLADVPTLTSLVANEGLIIVPYGVASPTRKGLTGERLNSTISSLVRDANPEIIAYEISQPAHVGLVVKGLSRTRVRPLVGQPIEITELSYVSLDQNKNQDWQITILAVDRQGDLAKAIQNSPFTLITEYTQPQILPASPREVISEVSKLLNRGDAESLVRMVSQQGLAIAPYGLVIREIGLKDESLSKILTELVKGSETRVLAYDLSEEGRIGLAVKGLKRMEVQPAIGNKVTMTSLAYMQLKLDAEGNWRLWLIAPDTYSLLAEAMDEPPFQRWR